MDNNIQSLYIHNFKNIHSYISTTKLAYVQGSKNRMLQIFRKYIALQGDNWSCLIYSKHRDIPVHKSKKNGAKKLTRDVFHRMDPSSEFAQLVWWNPKKNHYTFHALQKWRYNDIFIISVYPHVVSAACATCATYAISGAHLVMPITQLKIVEIPRNLVFRVIHGCRIQICTQISTSRQYICR